MDNVVIMQVQQAVRDLQGVLALQFVRNVFFFVKCHRIKTATAAELEHDAWIRPVQTNTESLHKIRVRRDTPVRSIWSAKYTTTKLGNVAYSVSLASPKNPSISVIALLTFMATFAPRHSLNDKNQLLEGIAGWHYCILTQRTLCRNFQRQFLS